MSAYLDYWSAEAKRRRRTKRKEQPTDPTAAFAQYADDPNGFAVEVLGITPWSRQREVLEAPLHHKMTAVRSGHKVSKSTSAAILTLWWISTRPRGRAILTSTTDRQVNIILWSELRRLYARAVKPIGGEIHQLARSGLVLDSDRYAYGFTADKPEAMAGISGDQLLYIVDEASGVPSAVFEAIQGNLAGGGRLLMFGNPTQTSGEFFDAFHQNRNVYKTIHVSSREAAGANIPGLATLEWCDDMRAKYGPDNPIYQVRVEGNFPRTSDMAVIGLGLVEEALARYEDTPRGDTLRAGLDVARFGSDASILMGVFDQRAEALGEYGSLDGIDLAGQVMRDLDRVREGRKVRLNFDNAGIGASVEDHLSRNAPEWLEAVPINSAESANDPGRDDEGKQKPDVYANMRAEGWFTLGEWLKQGGAIPQVDKLEADLVTPQYKFDSKNRLLVEKKEDIKKRLSGRSTDYGDALWLAIVEKKTPRGMPPKAPNLPKIGRRM